MPFVFSKLSTHMDYATYLPEARDAAVVDRTITIKGRVNVIGETKEGLVTPDGVVTEVSAEDLAILLQNEVFKLHIKNGFIQFHEKEKSLQRVIPDMAKRDNSAQLTPADYENTIPVVSGDEEPIPGKVIGAIPDDVAKRRKHK